MGEITINPLHNVHKKYRTMNFVNHYIFTPPVLAANTFIGGVASTINTPLLLANKLAIDVSRITNFSVVGSDIQCNITGSYVIPIAAFLDNSFITYYNDTAGLVTTLIAADTFKNANKLIYVYLPNCTNAQGTAHFSLNSATALKSIYIPRVTSLGATVGTDNIFLYTQISPSYVIYAHPSLQTNNAGGVDGDLVYAISQGATVRYVTNFTAPNPIANLSITDVYASAFKVNFTAPTGSTNAVDYYELWLNGVFKQNVVSGQYITGLSPNTSYTIEIKPVDIFYNKSTSSTVTQSTNTSSDITTGLVSYYKLDETSGIFANDSFAKKTLISTGIIMNQSGKISSAYLSNAYTQYLSGTVPVLSGIFSINVWCYRTGNAYGNANIVSQGNYGNGFGLWINASSQLTWFSNSNYNNYTIVNASLPLNTWSMVTVTYDGTNVKIYLDSVLKATNALTSNVNTATTRRMFNRDNEGYLGKIDEVSISNIALSQSQINILYNSGNGITLL